MIGDLKTILAQLKAGLQAIYGPRLERVMLFGSQARGDARPDSDIDVLVVLKGEVDYGEEVQRTSYLRSELSLANDCVVSCVYLSSAEFAQSRGPFVRNVLREGVAV